MDTETGLEFVDRNVLECIADALPYINRTLCEKWYPEQEKPGVVFALLEHDRTALAERHLDQLSINLEIVKIFQRWNNDAWIERELNQTLMAFVADDLSRLPGSRHEDILLKLYKLDYAILIELYRRALKEHGSHK